MKLVPFAIALYLVLAPSFTLADRGSRVGVFSEAGDPVEQEPFSEQTCGCKEGSPQGLNGCRARSNCTGTCKIKRTRPGTNQVYVVKEWPCGGDEFGGAACGCGSPEALRPSDTLVDECALFDWCEGDCITQDGRTLTDACICMLAHGGSAPKQSRHQAKRHGSKNHLPPHR
jgi:hypothetical protein